jgi:hypothetical protein
MDPGRVDLVLKYALLIAGEKDDFFDRELSRIHLIKLVYLADLGYAEQHGGQTFTGAPWRFYHYGPWAQDVNQRIDVVIRELGVRERRIDSTKFEDDVIRWSITDSDLLARVESQIPWKAARSVKHAAHKFGSDTRGLLHYVYTTKPMVRAAPGDALDFSMAVPAQRPSDAARPPAQPMTVRQQKRRAEQLRNASAKIRAKVAAAVAERSRVLPVTQPRYDQVFHDGVAWLDALAGEEINEERGRIAFASDIWRSDARGDDE